MRRHGSCLLITASRNSANVRVDARRCARTLEAALSDDAARPLRLPRLPQSTDEVTSEAANRPSDT